MKINRFVGMCFSGTGNIGDEMQSLAAIRAAKRDVDTYIDRDGLNLITTENYVNWAILNGWYLSRPESWPPSSAIFPLVISFHLSPTPVYGTGYNPRQIVCNEHLIDFLKFYQPIGARDLDTCEFLKSLGVEAYFSGCLTLTLDPNPSIVRDGELIVLVDVHPDVDHFVRRVAPNKRIVAVTHTDHHTTGAENRLRIAEQFLDLYSSASCVITSRLHCAMPCTGLMTPVLLLDVENDIRFSGLKNFCYHTTSLNFVSGTYEFDLHNPPQPMTSHFELRSNLTKSIENFVKKLELEFSRRHSSLVQSKR